MTDEPGSADDGFHRLHPLTPFLRGWVIVAAFAATVGRNLADDVTPRILGLTLIFLVPAAGSYGYCAWRFTRYRIERDGLRLDTGLLLRRTRYVRLDRLQAVDVAQPLIARLTGLAILRLDLAGQERSDVDTDNGSDLRYLSRGHAHRLRAELLATAAGLGRHAGEAPQRPLAEVPSRRLIAAIALSPAPWGALLGALAIALPSLLTETRAGVLGAVPMLGGLWHTTFRRFAAGYPYTVFESPDGLRLNSGLLARTHATVPPGRVQAISIGEPALWRLAGWVTVQMNVAGGGPTVLLPVATRAQARELVGRLLPGVDVERVPMARVPRRAAWLAPIRWRMMSCGADETVFVVRRGVLRRRTDLIPHGKVQSIRVVQHPLTRLLRLADVHLDTTGGPVTISAPLRAADEAILLAAAQAERSRLGRRQALPERWMAPAEH